MSRTRLLYPLSAALATALVLTACKKPEPTPPPAPPATSEPTPMTPPAAAATATVTSLELGNAVGADNRVAAPATTFAPKDTIYAAVMTATSDPAASVPGKLGAKWTHVDSNQVVHEESKDMTFAGDGVTDFQISKPDGWPVGKYKVDESLDGSQLQTREFEVK